MKMEDILLGENEIEVRAQVGCPLSVLVLVQAPALAVTVVLGHATPVMLVLDLVGNAIGHASACSNIR